jgi:hypothetical protein
LDFQKKNILIKPHEFDENETSIEWLTIFIPEYNEYNIDTLPTGLRNSASIAIRSLRSETRTELKKYLMNERRRIEKLTTDFQEKASKLETKFDQKMSQYNRDKDTWDSKVRYWREMSTKFMLVINTYWANEISVMVQRQAINDGYKFAMNSLEENVLPMDPDDCNVIRKIAQDYKFRFGVNIIQVLNAIDIVYEIVEALGSETDETTKKINLIGSIKLGSWLMLHKAYDLMIAMNMDYEQMKQHMITIYKSWSKTDADDKTAIEDDEETANMVDINNTKYRRCDICSKFHKGICFFSKTKINDNKSIRDKITDADTNKTNESENKALKDEIAELRSMIMTLTIEKSNQTKQVNSKAKSFKSSIMFESEDSDESGNMVTESALSIYDNDHIDKMCSDGGASSVMTPNIKRVNDFVPKTEYVKMPNNELLKSIGRGKIGCIDKVMVVPGLRDTLVSVSAFDKLGFFTVYGNKKVTIYNKNPITNMNVKVIAKGFMKGGLYYFNADEDFELKEEQANNSLNTRSGKIYTHVDNYEKRNSNITQNINDNNIHTNTEEILIKKEEQQSKQEILDSLHDTLGLSKTSIKDLVVNNGAEGLPLDKDDVVGLDLTNSENWYQGNMKSVPIGRGETMSEVQPGNIISADILAKFRVRSRNGNYYPFILSDHKSKKLWIYFGKNKDSMIKAVERFKREVILKGNYEWNAFRSDSETIMTDGKIKKFMEENNIICKPSVPYKHEQNGAVERHIGMVYDLARTLMIQNKVPESFFEDALKLSVLILNECRIPRGHNETPEQMFSGKKPDLRKIKKFFSKGMAHISKEERKGKGKLSSKATRVRYLGPSEYYKDAYVCYDTDNNRIIIRRDVKWFESLPNTIMDSLH